MTMIVARVTPLTRDIPSAKIIWGDRVGDLAVWGAVLAGLVLALVLFVYFYRSRMGLRRSGADPVFTLQDLRDMHRRGEISKAEFDRLRAKVLAEAGRVIGDSDAAKDD
jgi:hypothetical protein